MPGQPFEGAVLAGVDDGVGAPPLVQPPVEAEVVVGRGQVGRVVDRDGLLAEAAGRLDRDQDPAQVEAGEDQVAARRVPVDRARRLPPGRLDARRASVSTPDHQAR